MTDLLTIWRPGSTRDAIVEFLDRVDEIPPNERVAVFDNDGTLWSEKPNYTQLEFFLGELRAAAADNPEVADRPEYRAVLDGDRAAMASYGLEGLSVAMLDLFAGMRPEVFAARVEEFFATRVHPVRGVPYLHTRYVPMLDLISALRAHGFDCYVVSAGGAEFVRVISDEFYGVKPEGVVGSQIDYEFIRDEAGAAQLVRTNAVVSSGPNEGPEKPPNIQRILGRRPCVAGGNSAGDAEMLEYAMAYDGPSLALLVNHDDEEREYAYESVAGTFASDENIVDVGRRLGWTIASIRNDWETVFES